MSDKAEELARQLLEKTESGKLIWTFVPENSPEVYWSEYEKFRADLDGGFSFFISRLANGDNKIVEFELSQPGRVVLSVQANNFPIVGGPKTRQLLDIRKSQRPDEPLDAPLIARFRLFSDLFYAARKSAVHEDQTIEKVQQLLERLG
ncbi:MAG TPA: hypothetical protein VMU71_06590 [Terracidiphilus sp.]|nr:hypothetical protein [Terracidiphilus sp.]